MVLSALSIPTLSLAAMPNIIEGGKPYVSLSGGWNGLFKTDLERIDPDGTVQQAHLENEDGWAVLGAIGYRTTSALRGELEIGYRSNSIDTGTHKASGISADIDGDINALTIMANILYDFRNRTAFTPYIGLGLGAVNIEFNDVKLAGTQNRLAHADVWAPAAQGIVGVSYKAKKNINLFVNYHFLTALSEPEITNIAGSEIDINYETQSLLAGIAFSF